jgi:RNA polymerase sigma-70 factor (ECF subfamily)
VEAFVAERADRVPMTEEAFRAFYARTAGPLAGYLRRLTGSPDVAEDLLQDAYVRVLSAARVPEADDHRRYFLFRVATNLARDHFRRVSRRAGEPLADTAAPAASVHEAGDVQQVMMQLSPRDRELLHLAYVEGMTHREIAQVTGLMRASIKPLLFRARRRCAALLRAAGLAPLETEGAGA